MKKKERPILFPGSETRTKKKDMIKVVVSRDLRPGDVLKIGEPFATFYEFIYPNMDKSEKNYTDLKKLNKLKGKMVRVTSTLRMLNKHKFATLRNHDDKPFFEKVYTLFVDVEKGLSSGELLSL